MPTISQGLITKLVNQHPPRKVRVLAELQGCKISSDLFTCALCGQYTHAFILCQGKVHTVGFYARTDKDGTTKIYCQTCGKTKPDYDCRVKTGPPGSYGTIDPVQQGAFMEVKVRGQPGASFKTLPWPSPQGFISHARAFLARTLNLARVPSTGHRQGHRLGLAQAQDLRSPPAMLRPK